VDGDALRRRYAGESSDTLGAILSAHPDEYTDDARATARAVLRSRGAYDASLEYRAPDPAPLVDAFPAPEPWSAPLSPHFVETPAGAEPVPADDPRAAFTRATQFVALAVATALFAIRLHDVVVGFACAATLGVAVVALGSVLPIRRWTTALFLVLALAAFALRRPPHPERAPADRDPLDARPTPPRALRHLDPSAVPPAR
jgi:hypothetical protein